MTGKTYDLLLRSDRVLVGDAIIPAALAVRDGRVAAILDRDADAAAARTIDEGDRAIVPGFVDLHVHFDNPGDSIAEDFAIGTANAVLGGVTTVGDHPFTTPPTVTAEALEDKIHAAGSRSHTDFVLWGGLTEPHFDELAEMQARGVCGFKAFMPANDMGVTSATEEHLAEGMRRTRAAGGTILVHAEDRELILELEARLTVAGAPRDYAALARERNGEIELRAVERVLRAAEETGGSAHLVHLSTPEAVDLVTAARARGVRATCEVAAHHLLLSTDDLLIQGWPALCAPPLREQDSVDALWERLRDGVIDAVVSDHCPYDPADKRTADRDAFSGPFGIQGIREFGPLFLNAALARGWPLVEAIALLTTRPTTRFGLPGKGTIVVGADADIAVLDLDADWQVDAESQVGPWKWTPYAGMHSSVRVTRTLLRGDVVAEDGAVVEHTHGRFLPLRGSAA